jgi:hypothetical protein
VLQSAPRFSGEGERERGDRLKEWFLSETKSNAALLRGGGGRGGREKFWGERESGGKK